MGNCSYCGQPAGFLRKKHAACEAKHNEAWSRMVAIATDAALDKLPFDSLEAQLNELARSGFIPISRVQEAMIRGWEQGVDHFLGDGHLNESEEERLSEFRQKFSLSQDQLDRQGAYSRLVKGLVLRDVMNGVLSERVDVQGSLPFSLQKTEKLIWLFPEVKCYEDQKRRHYVSGPG